MTNEIENKIFEWVHKNFDTDKIILHMLNGNEAILVDNNNHSMFIKYENGEIKYNYDPLKRGKYHE